MLTRELDAQDKLKVQVYPTRHGRRITSSSFKVSNVAIDNDPDSITYTIVDDGQAVEFEAGDAAEDGQVITGTVEAQEEGSDAAALRAPFEFTLVNVNPDGIELEATDETPDGLDLGTDDGTGGTGPAPGEPAPTETEGGIAGTSEPAPTAPGGTGTEGTGPAPTGGPNPPAPPPPPPPPSPARGTQQGIQGSGDANVKDPGPAQVGPGFRAPAQPLPPPPPPPGPAAARGPGARGGNRPR